MNIKIVREGNPINSCLLIKFYGSGGFSYYFQLMGYEVEPFLLFILPPHIKVQKEVLTI